MSDSLYDTTDAMNDAPSARGDSSGPGSGRDLGRRDALKLIGLMAAAPAFSFGCGEQDVLDARQRAPESTQAGAATQPGAGYELQFFTDHEYETVRILTDLIIPADERSGSASEARVPEFIDFVMTDELLDGMARRQTALRGGLAWLDYQCLDRFSKLFAACTEAERREMIDQIAYPERAEPAMRPGVVFFNSLRDLTASGFFSSKMGVEDLQYIGNQALPAWPGCPQEVLDHIGLSAT